MATVFAPQKSGSSILFWSGVTSGDTTAPTLSGVIGVSAITSTGYSLAWPPGSDNVAVTAYEVSTNGGASWLDVGNVLAYAVSGRTPDSTDAVRVRAKDAAGNVSAELSTSVTLLPDTTPPVLPGTLTASGITQSSYTLSWTAGTDDVAVASYERSIDGGLSWVGVGNVTSVSIGGRVPGTTDVCMVRALDSSGNISTPAITTSVTLLSSSSGIVAKTPLYSGYAALRASISNWLHRSDVDERIPEFIQLAEARIARDLRMTRQLSTFTIKTTGGIALAALPSDWLESQRLRINSPYQLLSYMPPVQFADTYLSSYAGLPRHFTVEGSFLRLGPVPDQGYDIDALYFARVPSLVDQASNWLLDEHPGIYLWGALAQAATFIRDDEHVTLWEAKYRAEIEDAKKADMRAASSAGRLRIRAR